MVDVERGAAAARKGMRPGDVIVRAGQKTVETPGEVVHEMERAAAAKQKAILLLINQRGTERFVAIPLERA